jgi:hypothetical protein
MKPNGSFYFNLGNFLISGRGWKNAWYTPLEFLRYYGVDLNNVQADANGHWSMTLTVYGDNHVYPDGYMQIAGFGSNDPNVNITPNDVFMYVTI